MSAIYTVMSYGGLGLAVVSLLISVHLFFQWDIPKVLGDMTGRSQKRAIKKIRQFGYEAIAARHKDTMSGPIKAHEASTGELDEPVKPLKDTTMRMRQKNTVEKKKEADQTIFHVYEEDDRTAILHMAYDGDTVVLTPEGDDGSSTLHGEGKSDEETTVLSGTDAKEEETTVLSGIGTKEEETTILSETGKAKEEETTVLSRTVTRADQVTVLDGTGTDEEETSVLSSTEIRAEEGRGDEKTTVLSSIGKRKNTKSSSISVPDKHTGILIPDEVYMPEGTVRKVLDFMITHTDETID